MLSSEPIRSLHFAVAQRVLGLRRYTKRTLLVIADLSLLSASLWLAFTLRYGTYFVPDSVPFGLLMFSAPVFGVLVLAQTGLYRKVTRYAGVGSLSSIGAALIFSILLWVLAVFLSGLQGTPRVATLLYWMLGTASVWGIRQLAGAFLRAASDPNFQNDERRKRPVLIYGAEQAGVNLATALKRSDTYALRGFVERSSTMWGQTVEGHRVYRPERLRSIIEREGIKEILVATSAASRAERMSILSELEALPVVVRVLPHYEELAQTTVRMSDLRPVGADDLLGREPVPPRAELLERSVRGKTVMVTGAGGSIGSELVRQLLRLGPRRLVLVDSSENALYRIEVNVAQIIGEVNIVPEGLSAADFCVAVLGSVLQRDLMRETIATYGVQTIYHAAAYKHVPIVQKNAAQGLLNNTFGTKVMADVAQEEGVERFVLVSTDKAVRPSSLMGASKRLAEMILQAKARKPGQKTIFTMVRFGNVLDSSGSVVQVFRDQIAAGGPVTVTHPDMIRYFMSIPEAASLVIQAGSMGQGGEVMVLDMGEPMRIDTLARSMIRLMGRTVRDAFNPDGDIAIEYVGLRPGEKLKEELLLGTNTVGTEHARIFMSDEPWLESGKLDPWLERLEELIDAGDINRIHSLLISIVEGYHVGGQAQSGHDLQFVPEEGQQLLH